MTDSIITPPDLYARWLAEDPVGWSRDEQVDLVALHGIAPQLAQQAAGLPSYAGAFGGEWRTIDAIDAQAAAQAQNIGPADVPAVLGGYTPTGYWRRKMQLALDRRAEWIQTEGARDPQAVAAAQAKADRLIEQWQATRPGGAGRTADGAVKAQDAKGSTDWSGIIKAGLGLWALGTLVKAVK